MFTDVRESVCVREEERRRERMRGRGKREKKILLREIVMKKDS